MTPAEVRKEMAKIERQEERIGMKISKLQDEENELNRQRFRLRNRCKHMNRREVIDEIGQGMTWECTDCGF